MGRLILALDIGTSSVKSALYNLRGQRVGERVAQVSYAPITDHNGRFELSPAKVLKSARACIDATLSDVSGQVVAGVGISCFWHSMVGTNERGAALTPIYTWADTRAAGAAVELRAAWDDGAYHARTGCMLHASFWPARHLWLSRVEPGYKHVQKWLSPGEWLTWQLTGDYRTAEGMVTGTGLFDPNSGSWDTATVAALPIREDTLPVVKAEPIPSARAGRRWPALEGALWFPALGDGITSNFGSGATAAPYAAINYGTSAALRMVKRGRAQAPLGLFAYRIDGQQFLQGGAISNAGNLYAWARRTLSLPADDATLDRALAKLSTKPHGLTVLPFWHGERAPHWRDDLSGTVHGIRGSTTALEIACALREASFQRLALIADKLPGARRRTAIVGGGLTRSALQTLANVTGLKVCLAGEQHASLRGAALVALEHFIDPATLASPRLSKTITPEPSQHRRFKQERTRHVALEAQLQ